HEFNMGLTDREPWEPLVTRGAQEGDGFDVIKLHKHADILQRVSSGKTRFLRRIDGITRETVWETRFDESTVPAGNQLWWAPNPMWREGDTQAGGLAHPAQDLDGDGIPDVVLACDHPASVLAVSGKTGKVLWWQSSVPGPLNRIAVELASQVQMIGVPLLTDVDGDGRPDVLVAVQFE